MQPIKIYKTLYSLFGPQNWWPVTDKGGTKPTYRKRKRLTEKQKLEVSFGSILTQNTSWRSVMLSIENLRKENLLGIDGIIKANPKKIAKLIRPSNYQNQKARYLKNFAKYVKKKYNGKTNDFFKKNVSDLRKELLSIKGIGQETADNMILYAAEKPSFVVDAYTKRIMERIYGEKFKSYNELKDFFVGKFPQNVKFMNEFHALLVVFAQQYCTKNNQKCRNCPLHSECAFHSRN